MMVLDIQQTGFDYAALDYDTRAFVQEKAQNIHSRLKRTAEDVIAIGQDLIAVKDRLPYGDFQGWLLSEFDMTYRTAVNFMRVSDRFANRSEIISLPVTILYELAAPSTPDTVIEMVETGVIPPTIAAIREAKRAETPIDAEYIEDTPLPVYDASATLPEGFGLVNGKPFTAPLPDGKPVELPEEWKLPPVMRRGVPPALQMSENNEWYTPSAYVEAARELMHVIDCDPASNAYANAKVIHANTYYDIETNGLDKDWTGRIWLNPPYGREAGDSNQEIWTRRLIEQFTSGITTEAVLLVNAVTDRKWFQPLWQFPICFTDHRIRFYNEETDAGQPTHGNALVYLGPQVDRFITLFKQFGAVVRRVG